MLTKKMLKYRIKSPRVNLQFLRLGDDVVMATAAAAVSIVQKSLGLTIAQLQERLSLQCDETLPYWPGLSKTLVSALVFEKVKEDLQAQRMTLFEQAQHLRRQSAGVELSAFRQSLAEQLADVEFDDDFNLFADLEEHRRLESFKITSAEALVHRYNLGLLQGMMFFSQKIKIAFDFEDVAKLRAFLRQLKFHRLIAHVKSSTDNKCELELSGALSVFTSGQTYAVRIANFLPYLTQMSNWSLEADVQLKAKNLKLKLDSTSGLQSHYRQLSGYVPEEFEKLIGAFNSKSKQWSASVSGELFNGGGQDMLVPDLSFEHSSGKKVYLELFHKWHRTQLEQRIKFVEKREELDYIIAFDKSLAKDASLQNSLAMARDRGAKAIEFNTLPTVRAMSSMLAEC